MIRIIYPSQKLRRVMYTITVLFAMAFISFMGGKIWFYTHDLSWTQQSSYFEKPTLPLGYNLVIYELISASCWFLTFFGPFLIDNPLADFIADAILIGLPIRLLWTVKLPRKQRRMILLIFASGFIVTVASLFRATCQIGHNYSLVTLAMDIEVRTSLSPRALACSHLTLLRLDSQPSCVTSSFL